MSLETVSETPDPEPLPYRGLWPFTEEYSQYFFGRKRDIEIIASNLCVAKLTILYGASGVGKSSVLMAGVLPKLKEEKQFVVVLFREWQRLDFESALRTAVLTNETLVKKMHESGQLFDLDSELSFDDLLAKCAKALRLSFLFIFDQFEEYFLNQPSHPEDSFDAQLARAINRREIHANFLLCIREDSLSKLDRFHGRVPNLLSNILRLEHLDREAGKDAIRGPINIYNKNYPDPEPITIDDALVEAVLDQVAIGKIDLGNGAQETKSHEEVLSNEIEAPYLQMVMTSLWKEEKSKRSRKLQLETLNTLGNAKKIVRKQFDDTMERLEEFDRDLAAKLFNHLVSSTGLKLAHTPTDLAMWIGWPKARVKEVLNILSSPELRILRRIAPLQGQPDTERYQIFHDALATAISAWESRYQIERERRRKEYQLREAEKEKEKSEKEKQRLKNIIIIFIILLVMIGFFSGYALYQKSLAQQAKNEALDQKKKTDDALHEVQRLDSALTYSKLVLRGHQEAVNDIEFSSDGKYLVTASADNTAKVWDAASGISIATLSGSEGTITRASFNQDGTRVITVGNDKTAQVWDANTGNSLNTYKGFSKTVFSPDGRLIAIDSENNTMQIWTAGVNAKPVMLNGYKGPVVNWAFSPDSNYLVTSGHDGAAIIWSTKNGQRLQYLPGHTRVITASAFSPDGQLVVMASTDKTAKVWKVNDGQSKATLKGHTDVINSVAFSPDNKFIVTSSDDNMAVVWDALTGTARFKLTGHTGSVVNAVFSKDGQRIITASLDKTARVWDAATGKLLFNLQGGHTDFISSAAFSPDGKLVATASRDTTARTWSISEGAVQGGFRVTAAVLNAESKMYYGPCPVTIEFTGYISVVGTGKVSYRFLRSDGASSQIQTLTFDTTGSKGVTSSWTLGGASYPDDKGWESIEILEPVGSQVSKSEKAPFRFQCESNKTLLAPKLVEPKDNTELENNTTEVPLKWEQVPGAISYRVEVQHYSPKRNTWMPHVNVAAVTGTAHQVVFKTPQQGRWRVWAVDDKNRAGKPSDWWKFTFKQ